MERAQLERQPVAAHENSAEPILAWKVHILRENPKRLLLIVPVVAVGLLASYSIFHSIILTAAICFLFLSSLAEYLFPVHFVIDGAGAASRTLVGRSTIAWDRVKKYYLDDHGLKLSPLPERSRLEAYRGVYLRFGDNREDVLRVVRGIRDAGNACNEDA